MLNFLSPSKADVVTDSSARLETNKVSWLAPQLTQNKPNENNYSKNLISNLMSLSSVLPYLIIPEIGPLPLLKHSSNSQLGKAGDHPVPWAWKRL